LPFENRGNLSASGLRIEAFVEELGVMEYGPIERRSTVDEDDIHIDDLAPSDVYTHVLDQFLGPPGIDCERVMADNEAGRLYTQVRYEISYGSFIPFVRHHYFLVVKYTCNRRELVSTDHSAI